MSLRALSIVVLALGLWACPKKGTTPEPGKPGGPGGPTGPSGSTGPVSAVRPEPQRPYVPPPQAKPEEIALEAFARGIQLVDAEPKLAIEAFQQAVQANPKMHVAFYNLGVLFERIGDDVQAEKHYRDCLALAGDYGLALGNLTNLLLRKADAPRAVALTQDAANRFPSRLDLRTYFVKALVAAGQTARAVREAKAILREDEKNVGAMLSLAGVYYAEKKYELSAHALKLALKIDPENPDVHHRLGHAQVALGEKKAAFDSFQKAVELKRDFPEALNSLSTMLLEAGDTGRALNFLEEAVRLSPSFVAAHLNLGNAYRKSGDLVKAKAQYVRVTQLSPRHADAVYNIALLYLDHPMPDAADEIKRLEVALDWFGRYRDLRGGLKSADPASRYLADATRKLDQLRKQEARKRERERLKALKEEMKGKKLNLGGK